MLDALREQGFDLQLLGHAAAILQTDFPNELAELESCLVDEESRRKRIQAM